MKRREDLSHHFSILSARASHQPRSSITAQPAFLLQNSICMLMRAILKTRLPNTHTHTHRHTQSCPPAHQRENISTPPGCPCIGSMTWCSHSPSEGSPRLLQPPSRPTDRHSSGPFKTLRPKLTLSVGSVRILRNGACSGGFRCNQGPTCYSDPG